MKDEKNPYEDIINLPRPVSVSHPPMPVADRAAQFSPFAALTGHEDAITETARLTDKKPELDDTRKSELGERLEYIRERLNEENIVTITYFLPDRKKEGGAFVTETDTVKKIDDYEASIIMTKGTVIPINDIFDIDGDIFKSERWD